MSQVQPDPKSKRTEPKRTERYVAVEGPITVAGALRRLGDPVLLTDREAASYGAMISDRKPSDGSAKTRSKTKDTDAD